LRDDLVDMSYRKLPENRIMRMLTSDEVMQVHATSLEILEKVGISTNSQRIMDILMCNGAQIKGDTGHVIIPSALVEDALKTTPKEIHLYGRGENEMMLERGRVYFGFGGTPLHQLLDMDTGRSRASTKQDVANATRLGDALPNLAFMMAICGATDVPHGTQHLHELEVVFANTEKHVVWALPEATTAKKAIAMAIAVAGGVEELKKRPLLSCYSESISPLTFSTMKGDLVEFVTRRLPVFFTGCPIAGLTGPATLIGSYALGNAETLAALTLSQLINPGTPFIYGPGTAVSDLRTLRFSFAAPEWAMGHIIQSQLAGLYGLPTFGWGGCSDSKMPDSQAGAEAGLMSLMSALSGINMIHCCGYLAGSDYGSMEMAVVCDEIVGWIFRVLDGAHADRESLALDVIRDVGPTGSYLRHKHTFTHLKKEVFTPKLFDRYNEPIWAQKGRMDIREVAKHRVQKILAEHTPDPLSVDVRAALRRIVQEADGELG
jgi:trimethylamine--corrinoid protein Co-methyltransferase